MIPSVPTVYNGQRYASTLEADWACTFDALGWDYRYEPVAINVGGQAYRPDFWLPSQRVWCEVKGPHNERIEKPTALQNTGGHDEWDWTEDLVVVLRPPRPGNWADWHGARDDQDITVIRCPECLHFGFMDYSGVWSCRRHMRVEREPNKFWTATGGALLFPGELRFHRALRTSGKVALRGSNPDHEAGVLQVPKPGKVPQGCPDHVPGTLVRG